MYKLFTNPTGLVLVEERDFLIDNRIEQILSHLGNGHWRKVVEDTTVQPSQNHAEISYLL